MAPPLFSSPVPFPVGALGALEPRVMDAHVCQAPTNGGARTQRSIELDSILLPFQRKENTRNDDFVLCLKIVKPCFLFPRKRGHLLLRQASTFPCRRLEASTSRMARGALRRQAAAAAAADFSVLISTDASLCTSFIILTRLPRLYSCSLVSSLPACDWSRSRMVRQ